MHYIHFQKLVHHDLSHKNKIEAFLGEQCVGYLEYSKIENDAEILHLEVLPSFRRQGVGQKLIQEMKDDLKKSPVKSVFLEVRVSNQSAIGLYEKMGFLQIGVRRKYYRDNDEDAFMMRHVISS